MSSEDTGKRRVSHTIGRDGAWYNHCGKQQEGLKKEVTENRSAVLFHHITKMNKTKISKITMIPYLLQCCPQKSRSGYITNNE